MHTQNCALLVRNTAFTIINNYPRFQRTFSEHGHNLKTTRNAVTVRYPKSPNFSAGPNQQAWKVELRPRSR